MIPPDSFPALNATLNAVSATLLVMGYLAIRLQLQKLHAACMLSALTVSTVFLASYIYYHGVIMNWKETHFRDKAPTAPDWVAYVYLGVLISHVVLAVPTAVLALITAYLGLRGRLQRHVRIARWTLPIWLYVSVTGVVVYFMLYRLYATY
jgi:uncharacterized membrane protein YozB (DUF420 family)